MAEREMKAGKIREGDTLPGVGNGYVVDVERSDGGYTTLNTSGQRYDYVIPDGYAVITFHTSEGEEGYLIIPKSERIEVQR
jgi:hypothetical protein